MSLRSAIYAELVGDAGVAALIGTRLYPKKAPSSAPPLSARVTYELLQEDRQPHLGGPSLLLTATFLFTAWGSTDIIADDVSEALRSAIDGKRGTIGTGGNTATVQKVFLTDRRDREPEVIEASDQMLFGIESEYEFWPTETAPAG